ncbi:lipopolysaccharide transport periplasmic protein LptA [Colwelliaceae bacterium 6441]
MQKITLNLLCFSLFASIVTSAQAEKADLDKVIEVTGERTAGDLKNKVFSYIDNVVITQGTLLINADLVQVHTDESSEVITYIARGTPATFKQTLEDGTPIYLQANEIRFEPEKNTIFITGDAELRQEGSKVSGSTISYNFLTEQVLANGDDNSQVKTVLQPKLLDKKSK